MKKMTKKNPQFLKGIEFNIPLFNAEKQMYLCTDIEWIKTSEGKEYKISLSEVKQNYSVPERVDISLFIPHTDTNGRLAHIHMVEVKSPTTTYPLAKVMVKKSKLGTLTELKDVFYNMAKSM